MVLASYALPKEPAQVHDVSKLCLHNSAPCPGIYVPGGCGACDERTDTGDAKEGLRDIATDALDKRRRDWVPACS